MELKNFELLNTLIIEDFLDISPVNGFPTNNLKGMKYIKGFYISDENKKPLYSSSNKKTNSNKKSYYYHFFILKHNDSNYYVTVYSSPLSILKNLVLELMFFIIISFLFFIFLYFLTSRRIAGLISTPLMKLIYKYNRDPDLEIEKENEIDLLKQILKSYSKENETDPKSENFLNDVKIHRKNEMALNAVFHNVSDGIFLLDEGFEIQDLNRMALSMYKITIDQAKSLSIIKDLSSSENDIDAYRIFLQRAAKGIPQQFSWKAKRPFSEYEFDVEIRISKLEIKEGHFLMVNVRNISDRILYEKELYKMAMTDPLTGMNNRRSFMKMLEKDIEASNRFKKDLSFIMFDIDLFKRINDTYGHSTGDVVLKAVSNCTGNIVRSIDTSCRYGGEEFCIILPETDTEGGKLLAERLRAEISSMELTSENGEKFHISSSFGISQWHKGESVEDLINAADTAMYMAKQSGRNKVVVEKNQEKKSE